MYFLVRAAALWQLWGQKKEQLGTSTLTGFLCSSERLSLVSAWAIAFLAVCLPLAYTARRVQAFAQVVARGTRVRLDALGPRQRASQLA